jgi:hypothetical protein
MFKSQLINAKIGMHFFRIVRFMLRISNFLLYLSTNDENNSTNVTKRYNICKHAIKRGLPAF